LGGELYEPNEENPMIGWRGASRYYSESFKEAFNLECEAIKYCINNMLMTNIIVMIPFVRTPSECEKVVDIIKSHEINTKIYMMCEVPSNVILVEDFSKLVDGFSIGSNDLTQLTLGLDRDSELVQHIYDERDDAVKMMLKTVITKCKKTTM